MDTQPPMPAPAFRIADGTHPHCFHNLQAIAHRLYAWITSTTAANGTEAASQRAVASRLLLSRILAVQAPVADRSQRRLLATWFARITLMTAVTRMDLDVGVLVSTYLLKKHFGMRETLLVPIQLVMLLSRRIPRLLALHRSLQCTRQCKQ